MYLHRAISGIADTPAEVIADATEHGGDQPHDRLVICGYREEGHLVAALPVAVDAPVCERVDRIRETISMLARMDLTACAIVGYGTPLYGTAHRLITGLNAHGITVPLALYLTGGRCHSYLLDDWPEEGVPYPPAPASDTSTAEDTEGSDDTDHTAVTGDEARELDDHRRAAYRLLDLAVTRYATGGRLTDDETEILALQIRDGRVRDEAFTLIHHRGPLSAHRALWADLARRVAPEFAARAHTLLAVTHWHNGDLTHATAEISLARRVDPWDYVIEMLDQAITTGTPPHALGFAPPGYLTHRVVLVPAPATDHQR